MIFWIQMLSVYFMEIVIIYSINLHLHLAALPAFLLNGFLSVLLTFAVITLVFGRTDAYQYSKHLALQYVKKVLKIR